MMRLAYTVMRNFDDAEDAVQDGWVRALKSSTKLTEVENPRKWLSQVVWTAALDVLRRRKSRPATEDIANFVNYLPSTDLHLDDQLSGEAAWRNIMQIVHSLPSKEEKILMLFCFGGMDSPEIAKEMKMSASAVRSCLYRTRNKLKQRLDVVYPLLASAA